MKIFTFYPRVKNGTSLPADSNLGKYVDYGVIHVKALNINEAEEEAVAFLTSKGIKERAYDWSLTGVDGRDIVPDNPQHTDVRFRPNDLTKLDKYCANPNTEFGIGWFPIAGTLIN